MIEFKRWYTLGMSGFWKKRSGFYRLIAKSMQRRELLKDFVEGEYAISSSPATRNRARATGLNFMRSVIQDGVTTLADVLIATMPPSDRMALATLRDTSDPVMALNHLADNIDAQESMRNVVKSAVLTPLILMPIGIAFAYMISSTTIPVFIEAAPPEIWTGFNMVYRTVAELFRDWAIIVMGLMIVILGWLFYYGLPNLTAGWRYRAESAHGMKKFLWTLVFPFRPALQLYRDIQGTRMLTDLAFMLQSGRLVGDAIEVLAQNAQPWMRRHLLMVLDHMHQIPGNYVGAFSHGILSPYFSGELQSANRVDTEARFDKILVEIGTLGSKEAIDAVKVSALKLNLILMTSTMAVIMFFYGGQMLVIKSIEQANTPAAILKREAVQRKVAMEKKAARVAESFPK